MNNLLKITSYTSIRFSQMSDAVSRMQSPKFSLKEQTYFVKRLAFLINAGVPLVESLYILGDQMRAMGHIIILQKIIHDTSNGQTLSRSFAKFPKIFNEFSVQIIKVGESSGTLSQNLEYLAEELKKRQALRSKVIGAFIYPALITSATFGITIFLTVFLFPKIMPVFSSLHVKLPLSTRMMIATSDLVSHWGFLLTLGVIALIVAFTVGLKKNVRFHFLFDRIILRAPLFGKMIRFYNVSNACRTLGLLLKSGLRLSEALLVTGDTTKNLVYKKEFLHLSDVVNRGEKISLYLTKRKELFPDIMGHMVAVGERSGTLSETLVYLSQMYDAEVEDFTKNISTIIEPALMIVMGIMVGFIAISIITPIYGITQNLHA